MSDERHEEIPELPGGGVPERDGIGEEDNPVPLWFNVGFYGLIVFGLVYIVGFTVSGWSSHGRYAARVAEAEAELAVQRASLPTENPYSGDAAAIAEGSTHFAICAACHKPDGTGLVGPSLVDSYWKYGGDDESLFASVSEGRPEGMPGWGAQLGSEKIWKVLAYLETLPKQEGPGVGAPGYQAPGTTAAAPAAGS